MKRFYTMMFLLMATMMLFAQERTITGTVKDGDFNGEPLMGATIAVGEGKVTQGTVTDINGQ